jgi:hypothetical protein
MIVFEAAFKPVLSKLEKFPPEMLRDIVGLYRSWAQPSRIKLYGELPFQEHYF